VKSTPMSIASPMTSRRMALLDRLLMRVGVDPS
jgi:hypothetical protein